MNCYPMYFGTGGRLIFLKGDWTQATIQLKLGLFTRNYVGTIFGGAMFSAADPFHMMLLINIVGNRYVVWDKAGAIRFKKPGRGRIQADVIYSPDELKTILEKTDADGSYEFTKPLNWIDEKGDVVATYEKTVYIATKEHFKKRQAERALKTSK